MWWYICGYVLHVHGSVHICYICLCKSVYVCINVCMIKVREYCVYLGVCMIMCMYAYTCIYMYRSVYICIYVYVWLYVLVICYSGADLFVRSEPGNSRPRPDLDLCSLWIWYADDSKQTRGMIRRFVPVCALETGRWFYSKTASFHLSVCSYVFSLLLLLIGFIYLFISFHVTIWYILIVWLFVSLHKT